MKYPSLLFAGLIVLATACIKDDFIEDGVDPVLQILSTLDTLGLNESFQLEGMYLNEVGVAEDVSITWSSSDETIIEVTATGLATGREVGTAIVRASYEDGALLLSDSLQVVVGDSTVLSSVERSGVIQTTSSYALSGSFVLTETETGVSLDIAEDYIASSALPGLYLYLSNNANSVADAFEVGPVTVFSGAHTYDIPGVGINDYNFLVYFCKPFTVKVGDGEIE